MQSRKRFIYDIETNGLLDALDRIHSLVMYDLDTKELLSYRNDGHPDNARRMEEGVRLLNDADLRIGHNIIKFDEPALQKVYPFFVPNVPGRVLDTLILVRLIFPNIRDRDIVSAKRGRLPGRLIGSHGLEAWGYRVGEWKGDYSKEREVDLRASLDEEGLVPTKEEIIAYVWGEWNEEMQAYCEQDVMANLAVYRQCQRVGYEKRAVWDEMDVAILCQKIETNGFYFDEAKAVSLYASLAGERAKLEAQLTDTFGAWVRPVGGVKTPKAPNAKQGYWGKAKWVYIAGTDELEGEEVAPEDMTSGGLPNAFAKRLGVRRVFEGYPYQPIQIVHFNPSSRAHIADRLMTLYGWQPKDFTPSGEPKLDETVVARLPYDCAPLLVRYFTVIKRLGQLAEGNQAWLKLVKDGRVCGSYNTVGAVTRRATHSNPNIGQVPSAFFLKDADGNPQPVYGWDGGWGTECRELFGPMPGWWQVGTDASGLELRCLAHYMARWDNGEYGRVLLNGDIHTVNQQAAGLPTRDNAKTFIYGFLYGAGDAKIGSIVGGTAARGKLLRETFLAGLPALGNLVTAVKTKAKKHRTLKGLDGGLLHVRHDHAALNTLLQSAGAIICKKWIVLVERMLIERGLKHGWDGDFVIMAWVHDELQIAARTRELAELIGQVAQEAMKATEAYFDFRCPLDTDFKVGRSWADCH